MAVKYFIKTQNQSCTQTCLCKNNKKQQKKAKQSHFLIYMINMDDTDLFYSFSDLKPQEREYSLLWWDWRAVCFLKFTDSAWENDLFCLEPGAKQLQSL